MLLFSPSSSSIPIHNSLIANKEPSPSHLAYKPQSKQTQNPYNLYHLRPPLATMSSLPSPAPSTSPLLKVIDARLLHHYSQPSTQQLPFFEPTTPFLPSKPAEKILSLISSASPHIAVLHLSTLFPDVHKPRINILADILPLCPNLHTLSFTYNPYFHFGLLPPLPPHLHTLEILNASSFMLDTLATQTTLNLHHLKLTAISRGSLYRLLPVLERLAPILITLDIQFDVDNLEQLDPPLLCSLQNLVASQMPKLNTLRLASEYWKLPRLFHYYDTIPNDVEMLLGCVHAAIENIRTEAPFKQHTLSNLTLETRLDSIPFLNSFDLICGPQTTVSVCLIHGIVKFPAHVGNSDEIISLPYFDSLTGFNESLSLAIQMHPFNLLRRIREVIVGQTDEAETFHENPSNGKTSFPDVNGLPLVCSISGCHIRSLHLRFEVWGQQECMYVHTYMVNSIRHTPCIELLEVPLSIFISGRMCGPKQGEYKGYIFNEWLDTMQQLKYLKVATESLDMKRIGTKNYLNGISALFRGLLENCPCLETVSVDISGAWDVGDQMEKKEFQDSLKVFQQVRPEVEISGLDHQDE